MTNRGREIVKLALGFALVIGAAGLDAQATTGAPLPTPPRPPAQQQPRYDDAELDRVVSPVALYPDPLLAQLFTAATFAAEIPLAARWSTEHKELTGQRLTDAVTAAQVSWDPSVQAMLAFPTVLEMMAGDLPWTEELGDAFRRQPEDVMDAVQRMRTKAHDYGYLKSNDDVQVSSGPTIEILPVTPSYIVVPYYDPLVVYYPPRPRFALSSAIYFGYGVRLGLWFEPWGWGPGGFAWTTRRVVYGYPGWGRPWVGYGGVGRTVFYNTRRSSAFGPGRYAPGGAWSRDRDGRGGWNDGPGRGGVDRRGDNNDWQRDRGRNDGGRQGDTRPSGSVAWTRGGYNGNAATGRTGSDDRTSSRDRNTDRPNDRADGRGSDRSADRGTWRRNDVDGSRGGRGAPPSRGAGIVRGGAPSGGGGVRPGSASGGTRSGGSVGVTRSGRSGGSGGSSARGGSAGGGSSRGGGVSRGGSSRGSSGRSH